MPITSLDGFGGVALIAATAGSLDAEERGGAALAASLGLDPPASWPPEFNDADTRNWVRGMLEQNPEEPAFASYYVVSEGRPVGTAGFKGPPDAQGEVELGYSIIPTEQRKGHASGAVRLLLEIAFHDPRVTAVVGETIPSLIGSQRVLETTGFTLVSRTPEPEFGEILRYRRARD